MKISLIRCAVIVILIQMPSYVVADYCSRPIPRIYPIIGAFLTAVATLMLYAALNQKDKP